MINVKNNRGPALCYRDGGDLAQIRTAVITHVAAALEKPPWEISLKNTGAAGFSREELAQWREDHFVQPDRFSLQECVDIAKAAIDWDNKWHAPGAKKLPNGRYHGIGYASSHCWTTCKRGGGAGLAVLFDGSIQILANSTDVTGQRRTAYCAIVADEMGVNFEDVNFRGLGDFSTWELNPCGGSTGMASNSPSLVRLARKAKRMLLELGCQVQPASPSKSIREEPTPSDPMFPGKTADELELKDGVIFEKANPENKQTVAAVASRYSGGTSPAYRRQECVIVDEFTQGIDWQHAHCHQVHMIEVEVDPETGKVHIPHVVCVNDVGTAIAPDLVNGQQYGGAGMGLSRSNQEEVFYDPQTGMKLNDNLIGYPLHLMNDFPNIDCHIVETQQGYSAYGIVGIGENLGAVMCTITGNAVYNALGVWMEDYPTTPQKILKALGKA